MDGVMNDRTISVSNSRPRAIVVPIWPSTRRSLRMNYAMVKANTSPAAATTEPLPAIDRMMPVLMPAWISSLNRETSQHGRRRGKVSAEAVGGPRLDAVMIVGSVVPMLGIERGPVYHLPHLYWF